MKKSKIFTTTLASFLLFGTVTASAAQLMTYNGTGIWNKFSVGSFSLNKSSNTIKINHTTSSYTGGNKLYVKVYKQGVLGVYSDLKATNLATGTGSVTFTNSNLPSGVYKLKFERSATAGDFNISGSVSN